MGASEFLSKLKKLLQDIEEINRGHVSELHEWEEKELRNIFALLVVDRKSVV